jgi:hypothetical protein
VGRQFVTINYLLFVRATCKQLRSTGSAALCLASGTSDVGQLADGLSALSVRMLVRITVTAATLRLADASQHKVLVRTAYSEEKRNNTLSN